MAGARLALVVANEDYADDGLRRLAAPGRDADALAEILGDRSVGGSMSRSCWTGRRRLTRGAAAASAFLCIVTAAIDLAMFYAYPYTTDAATNRLGSYTLAVLLLAAVVAAITAVKPSWVKTLMTR